MANRPDYSLYHLHELEDALRSANSNEAQIIRELIAKGDYAYPKERGIASVHFSSTTYKWALVAVLLILFAINLYSLVLGNRLLALVPLALQGTILFMIYTYHKHTRTLIKVWSGLLIISGSFGLLSMLYAPEFERRALLDHFLTLAGGLLFFMLSNRFVELVPVRSSEPLESTR